MGLFSRKKTTYVSSVVYNMAGDVRDRPNYLKTLTVGRVLSGKPNNRTFTRDTLEAYLRGPGIDLRRFGRWARTQGYNANVGAVTSSISTLDKIDTDALALELESIYGVQLYLNEVEIGIADFGMWATQHMLRYHADKYLMDWVADFNEDTYQITIKLDGKTIAQFVATGFVSREQYLYVSLNQVKNTNSSSEISEWKRGTPPSRDGYLGFSQSSTSENVVLRNTTVVVQSKAGSSPVTQTFESPTAVPVTLTTSLHILRTNLPDLDPTLVVGNMTLGIEVRDRYEVKTEITTDILEEPTTTGVRTSLVTKTVDTLVKYSEYRTSKVIVREKGWENEEIFIYRQGNGNADLDALFQLNTAAGAFYPIIPIRTDNRSIQDPAYSYLLPWVEKAVRRATDFPFGKLMDVVESNPSLKDIDFAYVIFGASLNTPEDTAKRYIYEFLRNVGSSTGDTIQQFWVAYEAAVQSWEIWLKWYHATRYNNTSRPIANPPPEPERLIIPTPPKQTININSAQNYNIAISFAGVQEDVFTGQYAPNVHVGNLRIYKGFVRKLHIYPEQNPNILFAARWGSLIIGALENVIIEWQDTPSSFRRLTITGLQHINNVYNGKSVTITGWEALDDNDESGFIIPLHEETLRELPLPVVTQLCTASTYMMFNCYQVVKQKWYQTTLFKVIIVIIIIVISIFCPPAGGAAGGILGSNAAVGAAIGFSGTAAIVAGAIANAIVAMVVSMIISKIAVAALGDKIGGIVGVIVSFIVISAGSQMAGGQPMAASFGNMVSAENLMRLTNALSDGISAYVRASAMETQGEIKSVLEDYQQQAKALAEKFTNEFGGSGGVIDPFEVADVMQFRLEAPSLFLSRTLMNGTDIADMSHDMLDNFTNLTTSLTLE